LAYLWFYIDARREIMIAVEAVGDGVEIFSFEWIYVYIATEESLGDVSFNY